MQDASASGGALAADAASAAGASAASAEGAAAAAVSVMAGSKLAAAAGLSTRQLPNRSRKNLAWPSPMRICRTGLPQVLSILHQSVNGSYPKRLLSASAALALQLEPNHAQQASHHRCMSRIGNVPAQRLLT